MATSFAKHSGKFFNLESIIKNIYFVDIWICGFGSNCFTQYLVFMFTQKNMPWIFMISQCLKINVTFVHIILTISTICNLCVVSYIGCVSVWDCLTLRQCTSDISVWDCLTLRQCTSDISLALTLWTKLFFPHYAVTQSCRVGAMSASL